MDPFANIREQRKLANRIELIWDGCNPDGTLNREQLETLADMADQLAGLVLALDMWRRGGGFDPYNPRQEAYQ